MKKTGLWLLKAILGGLIAFVLLTGFCMFYYNVPVHKNTAAGATDYCWESNKFYSRATEGFAWGKTNNEGYLNKFDYSEGQPVDILVMGSSHTEGYSVAMDESTAAVLGELLPDYTVYNIGISGHAFLTCADNMTAAINKYKPSKYVLLEVSHLQYADELLLAAINEEVPDQESYNSGIIGLLQKNPFLRLMYSQLSSFLDNANASKNSGAAAAPEAMGSEELYCQLLKKLQATVSQNGAQLIIVYHPHLVINESGEASISDDITTSIIFADMCEKSGVEFLNMADIFLKNYKEKHILPHGFSNSSVGSGHLNRNGLAMIANAVYDFIKEGK